MTEGTVVDIKFRCVPVPVTVRSPQFEPQGMKFEPQSVKFEPQGCHDPPLTALCGPSAVNSNKK